MAVRTMRIARRIGTAPHSSAGPRTVRPACAPGRTQRDRAARYDPLELVEPCPWAGVEWLGDDDGDAGDTGLGGAGVVGAGGIAGRGGAGDAPTCAGAGGTGFGAAGAGAAETGRGGAGGGT